MILRTNADHLKEMAKIKCNLYSVLLKVMRDTDIMDNENSLMIIEHEIDQIYNKWDKQINANTDPISIANSKSEENIEFVKNINQVPNVTETTELNSENDWKVAETQLVYKQHTKLRFSISCPEDTWNIIMQSVMDQNDLDIQEHFFAVYLNRASEVLGFKVISKGELESVQVNRKLVFSTAILLNATGIIVAHNHPSGNVNPSVSDIEFTKTIKETSSLLGFDLIDHLIITKKSVNSIRYGGYLDWIRDGHYNGYGLNIDDTWRNARRISQPKKKKEKVP